MLQIIYFQYPGLVNGKAIFLNGSTVTRKHYKR